MIFVAKIIPESFCYDAGLNLKRHFIIIRVVHFAAPFNI
jgi:hypothetical protein